MDGTCLAELKKRSQVHILKKHIGYSFCFHPPLTILGCGQPEQPNGKLVAPDHCQNGGRKDF